ncbi:hypothetical protein LguiA_000422 [Lonicera macranthoides]
MFGFKKSPANNNTNNAQTPNPGRRTASEPTLNVPDLKSNPLDDDDNGYFGKGATKNKPKGRAHGSASADFDSMSVQELETYAVDKSKETTDTVNNCLKIAENIRGDATRTLDTLHQQGEQIERTHHMAADMDKDLSKGEKLLNNLGGMFSMPWKPTKTKKIDGPTITKDDNNYKSKKSRAEQREKLGLAPAPKGKSTSKTPSEPTNALQQVELEKQKQDDGLDDLSNILGDLKGMAVDMGSELDRQNKALDHLQEDVDELNSRVKGANQRARKLLNK